MRRREFLQAAATGAFALSWTREASAAGGKILYFTRSQGFEHSAVARKAGELAYSEKLLVELGRRWGVTVECTKDGRVFDGDLDQYDVIAFYTSGDLTQPSKDGSQPMSPRGKQNLLDAVAAGRGFVGIHSAADTFHSKGPRDENQTEVDPYIAMIGGEFVSHGEQQEASLFMTSRFPGTSNLGIAEGLAFTEEWYTFKNFARDLHVIFVQETGLMKGKPYQRPDFPATWARMHGKGRVYYTSLGHREDMWTNPFFQEILRGGIEWASGKAGFELQPNIGSVTPGCGKLKN